HGSPEDDKRPRPRRDAIRHHSPGHSDAARETLPTDDGGPAARRMGGRLRCDARLLPDLGSGRARGSLRRGRVQRPWIQTLPRSRSLTRWVRRDGAATHDSGVPPRDPIRRGGPRISRRAVPNTPTEAAPVVSLTPPGSTLM